MIKRISIILAVLIIAVILFVKLHGPYYIKRMYHHFQYLEINEEQEDDSFDQDYISPLNAETLVITAPSLIEGGGKNVEYLFTPEDVSAIKAIDGVETVYPTSSLVNYGLLPGITIASNQYVKDNYQLEGEMVPDVVWDQDIYLTPLDAESFLTTDEYAKVLENNKSWEATEGAYGSVVVPVFPFEVLANTTVDSNYNFDLLVGDYLQNNSDQLLLSDKLAYTICDADSKCQQIDQLIGTQFDLDVSGYFKAANLENVKLSGEISGIYMGNRGYNNVVLSYDSQLAAKDKIEIDQIEQSLELMTYNLDQNSGAVNLDVETLKQELIDIAQNQLQKLEDDEQFGNYPQLIIKLSDQTNADDVVSAIYDYDKNIYINEYEETE